VIFIVVPSHAPFASLPALPSARVSHTDTERLTSLRLFRLVGTLDSIPYRMVGTRRRVLLRHVLNYKRESGALGEAAMEELAAEAQELKMGY